MSAREIVWRVGMLLQDMGDRVRIPLGAFPGVERHFPGDNIDAMNRGFSIALGTGDFADDKFKPDWRENLIAKADMISENRLSYLGLENQFLGDPINWHRDHNSNIDALTKKIQDVDYRDFRYNGDCKHVWEPNRHHQFVVLARAYRATGDIKYAKTLADQFQSWIDHNPFGYGMNWRSPLELGVRLVNWVWALELVRPSGCISGELWRKIYENAYLLCWDTQRKYSRGSSANNHLVGEVAGVFVAACYFGDFPEREIWIKEAGDILLTEITAQSYSDGCTREQALGYQFFVMQLYLFCGLAGRWSGNEFPEKYWSRLSAMIGFVRQMSEAGPLPLFGDQDDGYALDLGDHARNVDALLDVASRVPELELEHYGAKPSETGFWLFGPAQDGQDTPDFESAYESKPFTESGFYLLQDNSQGQRISILFDCAELGYGGIAAHGHADALAFTLRAFGEYLLVDPGTYDYYTHPEWRNYFRTTAAHNTVGIDGKNQSEMLGRFLWGARATAECLTWKDDGHRTRVCGRHDGYAGLDDPVIHERTLTLEHKAQRCDVVDSLQMAGQHTADIYFHLGPACRLVAMDSNVCRISVGDQHHFTITLDPRLSVRSVAGSEEPICGWYSSGYHQKVPISTIIGTCKLSETTELHHSIQIGKDI